MESRDTIRSGQAESAASTSNVCIEESIVTVAMPTASPASSNIGQEHVCRNKTERGKRPSGKKDAPLPNQAESARKLDTGCGRQTIRQHELGYETTTSAMQQQTTSVLTPTTLPSPPREHHRSPTNNLAGPLASLSPECSAMIPKPGRRRHQPSLESSWTISQPDRRHHRPSSESSWTIPKPDRRRQQQHHRWNERQHLQQPHRRRRRRLQPN